MKKILFPLMIVCAVALGYGSMFAANAIGEAEAPAPVALMVDAGPAGGRGAGPAAAAVGVEPTQPSIVAPSGPCIDRDGPGPAPCIATPLDAHGESLDTARAAQKVGWPLLVLVLAFGLLTALAGRIKWLGEGYRALASAGLIAGLAAAANASFAGGSYYAMATAAAGAVLLALQGNRTVAELVKSAKGGA